MMPLARAVASFLVHQHESGHDIHSEMVLGQCKYHQAQQLEQEVHQFEKYRQAQQQMQQSRQMELDR